MTDKNIVLGTVSEYARLVQRALREIVTPNLKVDGVIGKLSMDAVCSFAIMVGCDPKEGFTPKLGEHIDKYIDTRFAKEETYRAIAKQLQTTYAHVRAVCEVESNGSAFLPDGRAVILFERHKFKQQLTKTVDTAIGFQKVSENTGFKSSTPTGLINQISDKNPDICNSTRGGYVGGVGEYGRLNKAAAIHIESAYASASYGAFQIMGFNHSLAGYSSATSMMLAFNKSEEEQLNGLVKFIQSQPTMLKALRNGDWATFALLYNGGAYKESSYDVRLKAAADRWKKFS